VWISDTPYLFQRVSSLVVRIIVACMRVCARLTWSMANAAYRALGAVTVIITRSWRALRTRGYHLIAPVLRSSCARPIHRHVASAFLIDFYKECCLRVHAAWARFIFIITSPIRLFARTLLLIISADLQLDDVRVSERSGGQCRS
jgi:hypothetical protein